MHAWCDQVDVPGSGAVARERRDGVVGGPDRARRIVGADCEQHRVVRRVGQARDRGAVVAAGGDHDDAVLPGGLGGVGQRVDVVALAGVGAVAEVEHPHVQTAVVGVLDDPVDGGDDLADVRRTVTGTDLDADHPCVRGDADEALAAVRDVRPAGGLGGVPADHDRRHVRAVAERVVLGQCRVLGVKGQVGSVDDVATGQPGHRRDTGVDHGDVDARTGVAVGPRGLRADHLADQVERAGIGRRVVAQGRRHAGEMTGDVGGHRAHARHRAEQGQRPGGHAGDDPVDDRQLLGHRPTCGADGPLDRRCCARPAGHDHGLGSTVATSRRRGSGRQQRGGHQQPEGRTGNTPALRRLPGQSYSAALTRSHGPLPFVGTRASGAVAIRLRRVIMANYPTMG